MKKVVFILSWVTLSVATLSAQKFKIEDALIDIQNGNYDRAKIAIDEAAANSATANDPKMWKVRGDVYYYVAIDTNYAHLDADASFVSLTSYINCVVVERPEKKKKNTPDALQGMKYATNPCYNKAFFYYEKGDYQKCLNYWELIIKACETDTTRETEKGLGSISKNDLLSNCASISIKMGDKKKAQGYFQKMIEDPKYLSPNAYLQMSVMLMEDGDTAQALAIIQKGRLKIPDDKSLFNQELSIYTQQGKIDILLQRLDEVIKNEPNNILYLFYRGAIVNDQAVKVMDEAPQWSDSAAASRKDMKKAKTDPDKKKHQAKMDKYIAKRDSIYAAASPMFAAAEKDYADALLIDPNYFDALFNMGVLYFNKNKELIDRYNYLDNTNDTKKAAADLEAQRKTQYEKAKEYLDKAFEIKQDDASLLLALQQTNSQLGFKFIASLYKYLRDQGAAPCSNLFTAKTMDDITSNCGEPIDKKSEVKDNATVVTYIYDKYTITFVNNNTENISVKKE